MKEYYDYYPFGMVLRNLIAGADSTRYTFTGKELDGENGLDWYYFGARYYDPAIGRWMVVDPMADKYPSHSTYNYCINNPLMHVDFNGRDVFGIHIGGQIGFFGGFSGSLQFVIDTKQKDFSILLSTGEGVFAPGGGAGEIGIVYSPEKVNDLLGKGVDNGIDASAGHGFGIAVSESLEDAENPIAVGKNARGQTLYKNVKGESGTGKRAYTITYSPGGQAAYHGFKTNTQRLLQTKLNSMKNKIKAKKTVNNNTIDNSGATANADNTTTTSQPQFWEKEN